MMEANPKGVVREVVDGEIGSRMGSTKGIMDVVTNQGSQASQHATQMWDKTMADVTKQKEHGTPKDVVNAIPGSGRDAIKSLLPSADASPGVRSGTLDGITA